MPQVVLASERVLAEAVVRVPPGMPRELVIVVSQRSDGVSGEKQLSTCTMRDASVIGTYSSLLPVCTHLERATL